MKHLRPRHAKKTRQPGPPRSERLRLLPRTDRTCEDPAPVFVAPSAGGRTWPFLLVVLAALGGYLVLFALMNGCIPFFCE